METEEDPLELPPLFKDLRGLRDQIRLLPTDPAIPHRDPFQFTPEAGLRPPQTTEVATPEYSVPDLPPFRI